MENKEMGDKEDKEYMAVKINSMIRTAVHFSFFD